MLQILNIYIVLHSLIVLNPVVSLSTTYILIISDYVKFVNSCHRDFYDEVKVEPLVTKKKYYSYILYFFIMAKCVCGVFFLFSLFFSVRFLHISFSAWFEMYMLRVSCMYMYIETFKKIWTKERWGDNDSTEPFRHCGTHYMLNS